MYKLGVDISPAQMKRLHKGHKVRVKKGTGFELLVHPATYNIVNRSFNKGKGSEIQLSPEEIEMNKGISKAISPEAHNPSLQPGVKMTGGSLRDIASHVHLANNLNEHLGTNYGYLNRAGLDNAVSGIKSAALSKMGIDARYRDSPFAQIPLGIPGPHSRVMGGGQLERGSVGRQGGLLHSYTPPALVSQPFSANFQFQHFLPPQYQHFNTGGHADVMGNGLYI